MAALFLDLMPDTSEAWQDVLKTYDIDIDYPVQEFVLCVGFFLVFIVEQMILAYKEGRRQDDRRGPLRTR